MVERKNDTISLPLDSQRKELEKSKRNASNFKRDNIDYLVKSNYVTKIIMHTVKYKSCTYYFYICTMHYCKVSCICSQHISLANISSWNVLAFLLLRAFPSAVLLFELATTISSSSC